ncbi:MAG: DUF5050 domain-containing protein [Lachnospiraceae bacterium]|nr:DUF5050 domain-containing protein [Lachnospiraceae bacterium]
MKKNLILRRVFIGILAIAAVIIIIYTIVTGNQTKFYDDESTTGNTSGNLLNGGLFCENEGKIYFANPYDENKLYSMDDDLSNVKKLVDDRVSYINSAGGYIFYTRRNDQLENDVDAIISLSTTGLFRINTSGHGVKKLYNDPTQVLCLYGNNVYYQHYDQKKGLELYSIKIDGSDGKKLLNEPAAPYSIHNGKIYYTGWNKDHYIHSLGTSGSGSQVIYAGNCTNLSRHGSYLYFMDMANNYSLCRVSLDGSSVETLVNERIATYNIPEDGTSLFYQVDNGTDNGLYRMDLTTMKSSLITAGDFNYLNFASGYLFYETFDQSNLYTYNLSTGQSQLHKIEKED